VVGALILCGGVALLSLSRSITPIGLSVGSFSQWYAAAIIAGVAFICVLIGYRRKGQVRATLTGLAAGLVFGVQDALTRQTLEITQANGFAAVFSAWAPYALVGAGIVGIWLMQNAFSVAPLHASLPAIAAGEPIAGIALGIVVFGDSIQITPGMLAIQAGGIAALIIGVVAVARSSAFSGLRKIPAAIKPGLDSAIHRTAESLTIHRTAESSAGPWTPEDSPDRRTPEDSPDLRISGHSPDRRTPEGSLDRSTPDGSPDHRAPLGSSDGRSVDGSADGKFSAGPPARKFLRLAHQREVHDSASGGEGR
jgi:uncharacterized membrane protein (UPF0136 family)